MRQRVNVTGPMKKPLETERLVLTEIRWVDLKGIHRLHKFAEVDEFNTVGIPETIDDTRKLIRVPIMDQFKKQRSAFCWSIRDRKSTFMGTVGLNLKDPRYKSGEVYYSLYPKYWGNGYATESLKRVMQFGFQTLNLHRIEAGVAVENTRSIRVLEKVGMQREGRARKILPIRGNWVDNFSYAILEEDLISS
ncbi:MAG: GNAT family N-acetyltransferase [Bacteroidota bacterium]